MCEEAEGRRGAEDLCGFLRAATCLARSPCRGQSLEGDHSLLLPHLVPGRLRPSGEHHLRPATSHPKTQGRAPGSWGITIGIPTNNNWSIPTPKRVCQHLCSQDPAPGSARASEGTAKPKWSLEPFAHLGNRLRCFVGYQSIQDHRRLVITGSPGACSSFFPLLANRLITCWHLTEVQHLLCFPPCD